jgi:hypothetical protein
MILNLDQFHNSEARNLRSYSFLVLCIIAVLALSLGEDAQPLDLKRLRKATKGEGAVLKATNAQKSKYQRQTRTWKKNVVKYKITHAKALFGNQKESTRKKGHHSKKSRAKSCQSTCPTTAFSTTNGWDATLLIELIGAEGEMDRNRLDYYLAKLQDSLISAFIDACPENDVTIGQLFIVGQSAASSIGHRHLQSISSNQIDNKVSVSYRRPPPKPDFSSLTKYALSQGNGRANGRKLEWGVEESMSDRNTRSLSQATLCPLQTTFLERLQATNDDYFLQVKSTRVSVYEGWGSFSYRYP